MIIPLEKQLSSLEPSKRLKELGVKQDGLYYWTKDFDGIWVVVDVDTGSIWDTSAFTVAEIFEILAQHKVDLWIYHNAGKYLLRSLTHDCDENEEKLADCAAKMLIYLLENKLISLPDKEEVEE